MTSAQKKIRWEWMDIAKGFGIIFVVYGHSLGPKFRYVYLFHLPLFMILSGYTYNEKDSFLVYLKKKILNIYVPFVGWNLLVQGTRLLLLIPKGSFTKLAARRLTVMLQTILCVNKDGVLLGATWYMGALFLICIVYKLVDMAVPRIRIRQYIILGIFICIGMFGYLHTLPLLQSRTLILSMFFAAGRFLKVEFPSVFEVSGLTPAILVTILFFVTAQFCNANMSPNEYKNFGIWIFDAFFGCFATIWFSRWLSERRFLLFRPIRKFLSLCGERSMDIMIWHLTFFYAVILLQLALEGNPLSMVSTVPLRYNTAGWWWAAYFCSGLLLSLAWSELLRKGPWGRFLKKICFVR